MTDTDYMEIALDLARDQMGRTAENPAVGCVLVKNGKVVGKGVTSDGGRPHGESNALSDAGKHAKGATAYVTLEPCAHHGQTPPCADALIKAGIVRCVIACVDPDPRVHWQGAARLQEAGIDTLVGIGEMEAQEINAKFFERFRK